jgi:murein L,D-transpeptidase YafK
MIFQQTSFKQDQLKHARVKNAYDEKETAVKEFFSKKHLHYEKFQLFIRAFKREEQLEVWVKESGKTAFALLHTYDFCAFSGTLGPKRKEGDLQIPEGVYHINHFNPLSNFHLSLGVSYPNASDKVLSDKRHPGGAIYVHCNCVTIGCIPITDEHIKTLYVMAVEAKSNGQEKIPIHIFPSRLSDTVMKALRQQYASLPHLVKFWENLQTVFLDFEQKKQLRPVSVNEKGEYYFKSK